MTSRTLGYTGNRGTNVRPDGLDRFTNIRIMRLIATPLRPIPALANGQMRLFDKPPTRAPRRRGRSTTNDYPAGPYAWTGEQARSCITSHAWAGLGKSTHGDYPALVDFLHTCWADPRPACWPPSDVLPADEAVTYLLAEFARIHVGGSA